MSKRKMVSSDVLEALKEVADRKMKRDPKLKSKWLDQVATSRASDSAGGIVKLETDNDWPLAFFTWFHNGAVVRE